ncbi:MAG TPA: protein kinase, partial [Terriglobia bacterium]|nr:protein kinase [Terriglobia bacterium]
MDERWPEIERIYHAALEREKSARAAFVAKACAGDETLRREVEFLLAQDEQAGSFLESPAIEVMAESLAKDEHVSDPAKPGLEIGTRVAHYRLIAKVGEGGMGEVYRARDTKLQRDVALKILPQALAHDADRMARFEREAQVLASLNHPNIAAIYGLEESDGVRALVMELVEGATLAEQIVGEGSALPREPKGLPYQEALPIARQIAEALEYAHEHGVIHRDLKPANVKITPEGTVKVLDFGLAKVLGGTDVSPLEVHGQARPEQNERDGHAMADSMTQPGMIIGTAAYMSPEQAKGLRVDWRCDIWAFGCVLYEMISGRKAFEGEAISEVLAAVLLKEPDWTALPESTPPSVDKLVRRCIQKDVRQRLQAIGDARITIEETISGTGVPPVEAHGQDAHATRPLHRALPWLAAVLLVMLVAGLFWLSPPPAKPQVTGMVQLTDNGQAKSGPLFTDGSRVYFEVGTPGMAQVSVRGGEVAPAAPISVPEAYPLDISSDGSELLVTQYATSADLAPLWIAPALAGSPRRVGNLMVNLYVQAAPMLSQAAAWSPDMQQIAFAKGNDLYAARPDGSSVKELVSLPGVGFSVHWSPDGSHLGVTVVNTKTSAQSLWELRVDGTKLHQLLPGWSNPAAECCGVWTPDGEYLVFQATRSGLTALWALPQKTGLFSRASRQPIQLTTGPMDMLFPALSKDGRKIFTLGIQPRGKLVRYDARSKSFIPCLGGESISDLDFSEDGQRVAYLSYPQGDLWRSKAGGSGKLQLTFPSLQARLPRWSPDGKQIAFIGLKPGESAKIYIVPA